MSDAQIMLVRLSILEELTTSKVVLVERNTFLAKFANICFLARHCGRATGKNPSFDVKDRRRISRTRLENRQITKIDEIEKDLCAHLRQFVDVNSFSCHFLSTNYNYDAPVIILRIANKQWK